MTTCLFVNSGHSTNFPGTDKERTDKINEYLEIAKENLRKDVNKTINAAQQAIKLSEGFNEEKLILSYFSLAKAFQQTGKIDTAAVIAKSALKSSIELEQDSLIAEAHHTLGMNYQFKGSLDLAIDSYYSALKINETKGYLEPSMKQLNNIALLYRDQGKYELALDYLEKCLSKSKTHGFAKYEFYSYGNLGYVYMKQNKYDQALEHFEKTLEMIPQIGDGVSECTINYLISDVKLNQGKYTEAKKTAIKAMNLAEDSDYIVGKVFSRRVLSDVFREEKNYTVARFYADEAMQYINEESSYIYYEDVLNSIYKLEIETDNHKGALKTQKQLFDRRDSLNNIKAKEKIANSEYKYQLIQQAQENQLLKVKNENNKKTSLLAVAIALLLALIGALSYFAYRKSKNYNDTLERSINERTKALQDSNSELERFTFITAHDLKEPTRNIVSYSGLVERSIDQKNLGDVKMYSQMISKNATQLYHLIDGIMKFSSIKSLDPTKVETVDLNSLMVEIQSIIADTIKKNNVELNIKPLPNLQGEKSLLFILFKNLIENAIKFNDRSDKYIEIGAEAIEGGHKIYVKDNGIGITEAYKDQIFEMFKKLHPKHEYDGSGLGLSICKRIANLHDHQIAIEDNELEGSTFYIKPVLKD